MSDVLSQVKRAFTRKAILQPMVADASSSLGADNDKIVVLAGADKKNIRALIANPGSTDEEVQLTCGPETRLEDMEIVDSDDNRCSAHKSTAKAFAKVS
jgi:hypothetical protein